ncbi:MAG TPA: hypothetical protein VKA86_05685 [Candidatus Krumholzibacteria bacterium]|nr:hypothetical protein [Candidatus Krumholzibacteria bacterium]
MDAVAQYLKALADPASLIDQAALDKLDTRIARTKDPIARVKLRAERARAESVDLETLEDAFVEAVPAWIEQEGIAPTDARAAFEAEGVPKAVLDRIWSTTKSSKTRTKESSSRSKKRTRVDRTTIEGAVPPKGEIFTGPTPSTKAAARHRRRTRGSDRAARQRVRAGAASRRAAGCRE